MGLLREWTVVSSRMLCHRWASTWSRMTNGREEFRYPTEPIKVENVERQSSRAGIYILFPFFGSNVSPTAADLQLTERLPID
jgi:hypothetical protein